MLKLSPFPLINEVIKGVHTNAHIQDRGRFGDGQIVDIIHHPQLWLPPLRNALWKFAKAKKCVLGDVCKLLAEGISEECSAPLQRLHTGNVYPL